MLLNVQKNSIFEKYQKSKIFVSSYKLKRNPRFRILFTFYKAVTCRRQIRPCIHRSIVGEKQIISTIEELNEQKRKSPLGLFQNLPCYIGNKYRLCFKSSLPWGICTICYVSRCKAPQLSNCYRIWHLTHYSTLKKFMSFLPLVQLLMA